MDRSQYAHGGFTLIELIVVISLVSIMLLFSVPRFSDFFISDNTAKTMRWIIVKVRLLKASAIKDQKHYILHADMDSGRLWITDESIGTEEEMEAEREKGFTLPEDVTLADVEFPKAGSFSTGTVEIWFNKKGFSDRAIIHIEGPGEEMKSLVIEPFLSRVKVHDTYRSYNADHS